MIIFKKDISAISIIQSIFILTDYTLSIKKNYLLKINLIWAVPIYIKIREQKGRLHSATFVTLLFYFYFLFTFHIIRKVKMNRYPNSSGNEWCNPLHNLPKTFSLWSVSGLCIKIYTVYIGEVYSHKTCVNGRETIFQ